VKGCRGSPPQGVKEIQKRKKTSFRKVPYHIIQGEIAVDSFALRKRRTGCSCNVVFFQFEAKKQKKGVPDPSWGPQSGRRKPKNGQLLLGGLPRKGEKSGKRGGKIWRSSSKKTTRTYLERGGGKKGSPKPKKEARTNSPQREGHIWGGVPRNFQWNLEEGRIHFGAQNTFFDPWGPTGEWLEKKGATLGQF